MAANHQSAALLLLGLLCLTATSSVSAQGPLVPGNPIVSAVILGRLYCSVRGNLVPGALGLPGVNVLLRCNGSSTDLARAVTDLTGTYVLVRNLTDSIAFDPANCSVIVRLPVARCALLPPTGILRAPITFLDVVPSLLGWALNFLVRAFELVVD